MDLVESLESEYLPTLRALQATLRDAYPALRFNVGSSPTGNLTKFNGHNIFLECTFAGRPANEVDNVALTIALCRLDRLPLVMADVCWGAPAAFIEDSLQPNWASHEDWPEADHRTLESLREAFPRLCKALTRAIAGGQPSL